jgi:hypothetical protein
MILVFNYLLLAKMEERKLQIPSMESCITNFDQAIIPLLAEP